MPETLTTKAWLLLELHKDIDAAKDVGSSTGIGFGTTEPWAQRLHLLRRCVTLLEQGPDEPTPQQTGGIPVGAKAGRPTRRAP